MVISVPRSQSETQINITERNLKDPFPECIDIRFQYGDYVLSGGKLHHLRKLCKLIRQYVKKLKPSDFSNLSVRLSTLDQGFFGVPRTVLAETGLYYLNMLDFVS